MHEAEQAMLEVDEGATQLELVRLLGIFERRLVKPNQKADISAK